MEHNSLSSKLSSSNNLNTKFYWVDERCVPPSHDDSNYKMAKNNLFENNIFNSGNYYNLFYKDKDYEKEAKCIHKKLIKHNVSGQNLLELGCGTGKHAITFSKLGYIFTNFDLCFKKMI